MTVSFLVWKMYGSFHGKQNIVHCKCRFVWEYFYAYILIVVPCISSSYSISIPTDTHI